MQPDHNKRHFSLFAKPLQNCIEQITRPVFRAQGTAASKIMREWPMIVGAEMAAYSAPIKLTFAKQKNNEGTLTVVCEGAHALALQHMTPLILERITIYFGYRAVARIAIEQRMSANTKPKAPKRQKQAKNIDMSCLAEVEDSELKDALSGLAKELNSPYTS